MVMVWIVDWMNGRFGFMVLTDLRIDGSMRKRAVRFTLPG